MFGQPRVYTFDHHVPLYPSDCVQGTVVFGPGEEVQEIVVKIVDDDMSEPDVHFSINLTAACVDGGNEVTIMRKTTLVTIVDDDDGGVLVFELPTFEVSGWVWIHMS